MWRKIIEVASSAKAMLQSGQVPPNTPVRYQKDLGKINFLTSKKFYVVFCSVVILALFYIAVVFFNIFSLLSPV